MSISLRKIEKKDKSLLLHWRNDPSIYLLSSQKRKVTLEEHDRWFPKLLEDDKSLNFIVTQDQDIGQLRLSFIEMNTYQITMFFIEKYRKMGLGSDVLQIVEKTILKKGDKVIADVLSENISSQNFFLKNGFRIKNKRENMIVLKKSI